MSEDEAEFVSETTSNKIDQAIEKYGLKEMAKELEKRWLGVDGDQESTRDLADFFNKTVLKEAVDQSETFTLSGNIDKVYRTLTDGDETDATLVRSRLEQSGVDVEAVTNNFVSHQTVYRYLKDIREVERPDQSSEDKKEDAIETIQRLRGRTTAVTERTIDNLKKTDILSVGEFSVLNDLQVLCESCGRSYDVSTFLERGGCECQSD